MALAIEHVMHRAMYGIWVGYFWMNCARVGPLMSSMTMNFEPVKSSCPVS